MPVLFIPKDSAKGERRLLFFLYISSNSIACLACISQGIIYINRIVYYYKKRKHGNVEKHEGGASQGKGIGEEKCQ
jgi:hypothetical protein